MTTGIKCKLFHADEVAVLYEGNDWRELKNDWYSAKQRLEQMDKKCTIDFQYYVDRAQNWHIFCATTALLRSMGKFSEKTKKPVKG